MLNYFRIFRRNIKNLHEPIYDLFSEDSLQKYNTIYALANTRISFRIFREIKEGVY
jgi:hypothetical protein